MGAATVTTWSGLVRSLWPQKKIYETLYDQSPFLGLISKDTTFDEKVRYIAVGTGAPQGVGPDFGVAKAAKTSSVSKEFAITAKTYYALFSIDGRLQRMARTNKSVIVKPLARETKNAIWQWKRDICRYLHGNGGGALFQASNVSGQTVTLLNRSEIRFVEENMQLECSTADGTSGSLKAGYVTVATVDQDAGSFTVAEASVAAGIPTVATTDYFFRRKAFGNVINGLEAWIPATVTATAFNGVDRTANRNRLAGLRTTSTATMQPRAAALFLAKMVHEGGGKPDLYVQHTDDWYNLSLELQSAGVFQVTQAPSAKIGSYNIGIAYDGIKLQGPAGPITVVADPDATINVGRMLTKETWTLASTGELVSMVKLGGQDDLMDEESADSKEGRFVGDLQTICEAPGWNARGTLMAA